MREAIVMLLLSVVSGSAMAAWVKVGITDISTIYIDRFMPQFGDVVRMWALSDFNASKVFTPGGPTFSSLIRQEEFNCKEATTRTLYREFKSRNMGGGDIVYSASTRTGWTPVGPGVASNGSRPAERLLFDIACRKG